jgi:hypothetical protein
LLSRGLNLLIKAPEQVAELLAETLCLLPLPPASWQVEEARMLWLLAREAPE